MIRDLPPLPSPQYSVARTDCAPEVPAEITTDLRQAGVPAGSDSRFLRLRTVTALLLLTAAVLTSCTGLQTGFGSHEAQGSALDGGEQTRMDISFEHAQIGQEYWVSLPQTSNRSSRALTVLNAEITPVPQGIRIMEYRADSGSDTDGHPVGVSLIKADGDDLAEAPDHAGHPVPIRAHHMTDIYYLARVKVTGPIRGAFTKCRYRYRQGSTTYQQDLPCQTDIRLGTPLRPTN
ncbi:hypothetical protein ACIPRD_14805 [Streptomyces sp. NPDC090108]|uniref:hypothetical protein n=1 Tax=Streptomyces sp. NPDC090108 TaxID=3365947 RepID=UPI00382524DE